MLLLGIITERKKNSIFLRVFFLKNIEQYYKRTNKKNGKSQGQFKSGKNTTNK